MSGSFKYGCGLVWNCAAFCAVLLLTSHIVYGQRYWNINNEHLTTAENDTNIIWKKIVLRKLSLSDGRNIPLSHLKDTAGSETDINLVVGNVVKNDIVHAHPSINRKDAGKLTDSFMLRFANYYLTRDYAQVSKYFIVETWEFNRKKGEMVVKIQWVAPLDTGNVEQEFGLRNLDDLECTNSDTKATMFWMKFDELGEILKKHKLTVPRNAGVDMSCFDFFESRAFSSKIICVSNPYGTSVSKKSDMEDIWVY